MISIEKKHLVLRPKTNSTLGRCELPLLAGYLCPLCDQVVSATVRLELGQDPPKISLYHENTSGLTVSYHTVPLSTPNGEQGAMYLETGHNRPGKLSDTGRNTSGTCGVTRLVIEPDPLRRVLQFLRILSDDFPQPAPHDYETVACCLVKFPELVDLIEDEISKKGGVIMPDRTGSPIIGYAIRYHAWSNWALMRLVRPAVEQAKTKEQAPCSN